jgi:Flp pilus assembly protein TadG
MALVMPILLSVCFGVVEYGDYFYVKNTIQSAVNAGCRAGAASGSLNTDVTTAVSKMMSASGFSASTYTTSILDSSGNALDLSTVASNVTFQVKVTANWSTIGIHVLPSSLGGIATSKQVICTASMNTD